MAKVRIQLPEQFIFTARLKVRVTDLNYGAHVGNDRMLGFLHEARFQLLRSLGARSEVDMQGIRLVVSDAALSYHAEVFVEDELEVSIALGEVGTHRLELLYRVHRPQDAKVVARGLTGLAFLDAGGTVVPPPPNLLKGL